MMKELLVIIDGNSLVNRAFYALPELMNKKGQHTNAIYGFTNILFRILEEYNPTYLTIAFDLKAPTFRHKEYEGYKSHRKGMPNELREQIEPLKKTIDAFGISRLELEGYEADDIIGTVAKIYEKQNIDVYIITGDKDALQLASDTTKILLTKKGISELDIYDEKALKDQYGITPLQFIDLKGLMGDKSDNIPGVPGIGEKTGLKLLLDYGSLEDVYENLDSLSAGLKKKLEENYDQAFLSKRLATIVTDMPIEIDLNELRLREKNIEELSALFNEFEFNTLLSKIKTTPNPEIIAREMKLIKVDKDNIEAFKISANKSKEIFIKASAHKGNIRHRKINILFIKIDDKLYLFKEDDVILIKDILEDEGIKKSGFDLKQDYILLLPYEIELDGIYFDVEIGEYLIDSSGTNNDLSILSKKYGAGDIKSKEDFFGKGKSEKNLMEIPEQELFLYYWDVLETTERLKDIMMPLIKENEMENLFFEIEIPLIKVLGDMEYHGIMVRKDVLDNLKEKFSIEISLLEKDIYSYSGEEFNINSPKQLGHILFDKLELPVIKKTKTGYSTNAEVLEALKEKHPIIGKITLYRQYTKLQSTYVEGLSKIINPDTGRIHSSFNQTITTTGRISSTDPNLQNIPVRLELGRELRKVFVSKEESILVDADYSQIELRVLAHISDDKNLIEAFSKNIDIHTATASEVFNVAIEDVTKELRSAAKAVNFGIVYGISDFGLSNNLGIPVKIAKEYIESYFAKYPNVKKYMENVVKDGETKGYVSTLLGRRRYIPEISSKNFVVKSLGKRLAMNTPIQGTAADIIKIAMLKVWQRIRKEKLESRLILQVHDELIVEAPENEKEIAIKILKEEMENAVKLNVQLKADIESGKSWFDTK